MPRPSRLVLPFGNSPAFESAMAEVGGESAKVLLASAWKTALSDKPRYTGTRRTGSGAEISRSSISLTDAYAIDSETVRRLPQE